MKRRSVQLRFVLALLVGGSVPRAAHAQPPRVSPAGGDSVVRVSDVPPVEIAPLNEEKLRAYAQAFIEIAKAQDQVHAELARPANKTSQALTSLRERIQQQVSEILVKAGLTLAEYREITYAVSIDEGRRQAFEQILAQLGAGTERG